MVELFGKPKYEEDEGSDPSNLFAQPAYEEEPATEAPPPPEGPGEFVKGVKSGFAEGGKFAAGFIAPPSGTGNKPSTSDFENKAFAGEVGKHEAAHPGESVEASLRGAAEGIEEQGQGVMSFWDKVAEQNAADPEITKNIIDNPEVLKNPQWWASKFGGVVGGFPEMMMAGAKRGADIAGETGSPIKGAAVGAAETALNVVPFGDKLSMLGRSALFGAAGAVPGPLEAAAKGEPLGPAFKEAAGDFIVGAATGIGLHGAERAASRLRTEKPSAVDQAMKVAVEKSRAEGGDSLDQTLAAAVVHAEVGGQFDAAHHAAREDIERTNKAYEEGQAQAEEDAARATEQEEAAGRYEAEMIRQHKEAGVLTKEGAFARAEEEQTAGKEATSRVAEQQKIMQQGEAAAKAAPEAAKPTLADVTPKNLREVVAKRAAEKVVAQKTPKPVETVASKEPPKLDAVRLQKPKTKGEPWVLHVNDQPTYQFGKEKEARAALKDARQAIREAAKQRVLDVAAGRETGQSRQINPIRAISEANRATNTSPGEVKPIGTASPGEIAAAERAIAKPSSEPVNLFAEPVHEAAPSTEEVAAAAHEAAPSPENDLPAPTEAQHNAGNFKMGHTEVQGLPITIEYPKGSERPSSAGPHKMEAHYGYYKGTKGADNMHVDVILGDHPDSPQAYVVDHLAREGGFEQHKTLVGFKNRIAAIRAYKKAYPRREVGPITEMSTTKLKEWLYKGDTTKPLKPNEIKRPATKEQLTEFEEARNRRAERRQPREDKNARFADEAPPVTHEQKGRTHEVKSAGGFTRAVEREGALQVIDTGTERGLRSRGEGTARLKKLIEVAHAQGKKLISDNRVSEPEQRVYARLKADGYEVKENPSRLDRGTGEKIGASELKGVYEVSPPSSVPLYRGKAESAPVAQGPAVEKVREALDPLLRHVGEEGVSVVAHPRETPPELYRKIKEAGQENARGVYDPETDTVHVFAENHTDPEHAVRTAVHEIVAHKGIKKLLGSEWAPVMDDVYKSVADSEWVKDCAHQHGLDAEKPGVQRLLADEYAASLAERDGAFDSTVWRRLVDTVRTALRKFGVDIKWTDNDIRALLRKSKSNLASVSERARAHATDTSLRFASKERKSPVEGDDNPLNIYDKLGATVEDQANYNPGFIRSRLDSIKDFGQNHIDAALAFIPRRNLPDFMPPGKMKSMSEYVRAAQRMDGRRNELLDKFDATAKKWLKYTSKNKDGARTMGELMHAATLSGVDPSKPYEAVFKNASTVEAKQFERERRAQHGALQKFWSRLDDQGKAIFNEVRDSYAEHRKNIEAALEKRIDETEADDKTKKALMTELRQKFESGRIRGPYFPLARFGKYWASAKDPQGNVMAFSKFEKPSDQRAWKDEMRKTGLTIDGGENMTDADTAKRIDPAFVSKVTQLAKGVDPKLADEIWQAYLRAMPELSMRKHFIHRKGRLGFTADAVRSFGFNTFHGSHQLARLEHMSAMEGHLTQMEKEARALEQAEDKDAKWAAPLVKEFSKRHEWARNPKSSALASTLTTLGFGWYLGTTPAAALTNLTQTPMVAFPTLAGRFNWMGAGRELGKAAAQFAGSRGDFGNRLRGDERAAWDEAKRVGLFDKTNAHSLAGIADEGVDYTSVKTKVTEVASYLFHKAEEFNRQVTYMAAYRLARKKGIAHDEAINTAEDLTWDSHFDYSNVNRSRIMQGDTAKVLLLFRQYSANMTYRLARDFNDSFRGADPEMRSAARKRFAGIMGQTAIFAGVTGLPLYWLVEKIVNSVFGDEDQPYDMTSEMRSHLVEQYGEGVADAIVKGPVDAITGATLSSRVGLNNLWIREAPPELEGQDLYLYYLGEIAGPLPNIAKDIITAAALKDQGYGDRALEKVMPKVGKDLAKTLRYARDGVTNLRGDVMVSKDELTKRDLFLQSIGFTPSIVTKRFEENRAVKTAETIILQRRAQLMDQLFLAARNEDRVGIRDTIKDIGAFNKKNPGVAIGAENIIGSAKSRARYSLQSQGGVHIAPGLTPLRHRYKFEERTAPVEESTEQ